MSTDDDRNKFFRIFYSHDQVYIENLKKIRLKFDVDAEECRNQIKMLSSEWKELSERLIVRGAMLDRLQNAEHLKHPFSYSRLGAEYLFSEDVKEENVTGDGEKEAETTAKPPGGTLGELRLSATATVRTVATGTIKLDPPPIVRPPAHRMASLLELVMSRKAFKRFFEPAIIELRHEIFEALAIGDTVEAAKLQREMNLRLARMVVEVVWTSPMSWVVRIFKGI